MILLRHLSLVGLLTGAPLPLAAQTGTPAAQDEAPSAEAKERYDALEKEAQAAMEAWYAEMRTKQQAGEAPEDPWSTSPVQELLPRFLAAAADYQGTEGAVPFHLWVTQNALGADMDAAKASFSILCRQHTESPQLEPLSQILRYGVFSDVDEELALLSEKSSLAVLREQATFALHSGVLANVEHTEQRFRDAKEALQALAATTEDEALRQQIEGKLRIAEKFAMGMVAPDIVGLDLDGTEFKLSDYEGKVVFLDFWGDW